MAVKREESGISSLNSANELNQERQDLRPLSASLRFPTKQVNEQVWIWRVIVNFHNLFLLSSGSRRANPLQKECFVSWIEKKSPFVACHQSSFPLSEMSHHNGLTVFLSETHFFKTPYEKDRTTGGLAVSPCTACKANEHVLGLLTDRDGVKDTIGIPPRISLMTQFCCWAWALHTVPLPCLSRDTWPPSKSSSHTCNHFICNSGGLFPLWRPVSGAVIILPQNE